MSNKAETGKRGEELASKWLERKGYQLIHRNWRHGRDEVDIICQKEQFLIFVEVKTRSSSGFLRPETSVDARKQECLMRAAENFIELNQIDKELRFDVISIAGSEESAEIIHIQDAFYPTLQ